MDINCTTKEIPTITDDKEVNVKPKKVNVARMKYSN